MNLLSFWTGLSGFMAVTAAAVLPEGWLLADGSDVLRADHPELFNALTLDFTADTTSGSPDLTNVSPDPATLGLAVGMDVQVDGVAGVVQIDSISGTTVVLSGNADATDAGVAGYASPYGLGNGTTTFGLPDMTAETTVGRYAIKT